ncbi:MAG: hypothetical protein LBC41_09230, partial [Clostridiales bacterium]|nr:hypothetical protein [Clostridiales bacterium]
MSRHIKLAFFLILLVVTGCSGYESGLPESHADGVTNEATYNYLDFFAEESVHDLYVELAEEDWQDMLENPDGKEYCQAGVSIDGIALEKVGFRTKGNSSLRMTRRRRSERYPFHIKFDKY